MNVMYLALALLLANEGYGSLSFDELVGISKRMRPSYAWLALAGGVAGAIATLMQRDFSDQMTHGEIPAQEKAESAA
jgi:hypothetical protein